MHLKSLSLALATTALAALSLPALAQDKSGPNVGTATEAPAPGGAATMALAQELYAVGVAQGDAVTVLAAARLAASVELASAEPAALDPAKVTFGEGGDQETFRARKAAPAAPAAPRAHRSLGSIRTRPSAFVRNICIPFLCLPCAGPRCPLFTDFLFLKVFSPKRRIILQDIIYYAVHRRKPPVAAARGSACARTVESIPHACRAPGGLYK